MLQTEKTDFLIIELIQTQWKSSNANFKQDQTFIKNFRSAI